jgi:hypothetical protein
MSGRPQPDQMSLNQAASQQAIPVLMSLPDLSEVVAAQTPSTPRPFDPQPSRDGLPSGKFKLAVPPVATLGGLIGLAVVLVLVLISRGGDESTESPTEAPANSSGELVVKHPPESGQPAGKAQMARFGLEDAPHDNSQLTKANGGKENPYIPGVGAATEKKLSLSNPQPERHTPHDDPVDARANPIDTQQSPYPQTNTPWPVHLEAKRPDRSATARPPV